MEKISQKTVFSVIIWLFIAEKKSGYINDLAAADK